MQIKNRQPPQIVKQLQQVLGLFKYYRRFIKDFSKLAYQLNDLLKKEVKWFWSSDCSVAFETLKKKLISDPILRLPNPKAEFTLYTDASGYALGAILAQRDEFNHKYVCAYASRTLRDAEIFYSVTEKECLA